MIEDNLNGKKYFWKPTNQKINPKKIFGFDIETYSEKNIFLMGSIYGENFLKVFWDLKEMQNFFLTSKIFHSSILFATNLGFDFLGIFGNSFEMMSKFDYIINGSNFISIKHKLKKGNVIQFLDTFNFFKCSVETMGEILKIPKLKKPDFLGKIPKNREEEKELQEYNIRDSEITFKFASMLQETFNNLGTNIKCTIASTSMSLFTNKYLKYWIEQPEIKILKEQYKGYYGGRCELFYKGLLDNKSIYFNKNIKLYDINSLYPDVMKNCELPFPNSLKISDNPNIDLILNYEGLSKCNIYIESILYPLLPFRCILPDGSFKLIFPSGFFSGYYTHCELRKAISLGYKITPIRTMYYTETFNPFKEFVTDLYELRNHYKSIDSPLQYPVKILLNSLYGKTAQRLTYSNIYFSENPEHNLKINECFDTNTELKSLGLKEKYKIDSPDYHNEYIDSEGNICSNPRIWYITDLEVETYPKFINPILAIYITSLARLKLYDRIETALKNNKNVFYCDTDSIVTDYNFKTSKLIGDLKEEYHIKRAIFIKPKFYYIECFNGEKVFKTKGLIGIKNFDMFKSVIRTGKYNYNKFTKFKESLRTKNYFNEIQNVKKDICLEDNKRKWFFNFNMSLLQFSSELKVKEVYNFETKERQILLSS